MGTGYEYDSPTKLTFPSCNRFTVPASIILDSGGNEKRLTAFSYFSVRRALDNSVMFSVGSMIKWLGKKRDRRKDGLNDKIAESMKYVIDAGYVSVDDEFSTKTYMEGTFDLQAVSDECDGERYATIYLDELDKIVKCRCKAYSNVDVILLVFAYLRMMIYKRSNKFLPEQSNVDEKRRNNPEVYDCHYKDIAEKTGVSVKRVMQAVDALVELRLIYVEELPRIKQNGKWVTNTSMFCNTYKREAGYLLASGKDYYLAEIANKKRKLRV